MGLLDHKLIVPSQTSITISHTTRHEWPRVHQLLLPPTPHRLKTKDGWPRVHQLLLPPHIGSNQKMGGQGYTNSCYYPT